MMPVESAFFGNEEPPTLIRRRPAEMERRKTARLPIEIEVHVEGAAHRFDATTGDLSSGGMFVLTHRSIPVGTHVMLGFTLPNGTPLEVLGAVQWQHTGNGEDPASDTGFGPRGPGLGLSFFCLEPGVKALLERFCVLREALYYR
jgi:uncharacterized protein (TIGR02266 family)